MNRRDFITSIAASTAFTSLPGLAQSLPHASISIDTANPGPSIPLDFTGLSYESAQLANPDFFSRTNKPLIELFRGLTPHGNLRLGGGSSEFTTYSNADPTGPPPFEIFGPDTSKTVKHGTTTTALALRNLRGFLDATGWTCLYGLNLGQGTKENAALEAAAAFKILGPRLLAFQIGNEPDSFRNRYRPATYGPADFIREWNEFHDAIVVETSAARFAGPDISNKLSFLTAFAEDAPKHPDIILLTAHYYAMGPARSPDATLDQLFAPDPKLATLHRSGLPVIANAMRTANLPFRISEGNSCWDGGKPGVSDTLASALWCTDMMLRFAQYGWSGVNLHGGGNGFYTPIAGSPSAGFTRRPEYFGIQFIQSLLGSALLPVTLTGANPRVSAYALQSGSTQRIVVINASTTSASIDMPKPVKPTSTMLTGPSLTSTSGISISTQRIKRSGTVTVPPQSAVIYGL
jgi:hypothetical protein